MTPQLLCSITWYKIAGGTEAVNDFEPIGWKNAKLILERDPLRHCLVEFMEVPYIFFGPSLKMLQQAREEDGPEALIYFSSKIKDDEVVGFESLFEGLVDMKAFRQMSGLTGVPNKMSIPIIQDNLWTRLIKRWGQQVNVQSAEDLDGNAVDVITPKTLRNLTQIIDKTTTFQGDPTYNRVVEAVTEDNVTMLLGNQINLKAEVREIVELQFKPQDPATEHILLVKDFGDLIVSSEEFLRIHGVGTETVESVSAKIFIRKNDEAEIELGGADVPITPATNFDENIDATGTETLVGLVPGDKVYIYVKYNVTFGPGDLNGDLDYNVTSSGLVVTFLQKTTYPNNTSPCHLVHDVGYSIINRIVNSPIFRSPFFGHETYTAVSYDETSKNYRYVFVPGYQVRGFTLSEKLWSQSFEEWYNMLDNTFMLGCGQNVENKTYEFEELVEGELSANVTKVYTLDRVHENGFYVFSGSITATKIAGGGTIQTRVVAALNGVEVTEIQLDNDGTEATLDFAGSPYNITGPFNELRVITNRVPGGIGELDLDVDFSFEGSQYIIEVLGREEFFDSSSISTGFGGVKGITTSYDQDKQVKGVRIGNPNAGTEEVGSIDDPQWEQQYVSRLQRSGTDVVITSQAIAAGLTYEVTRRKGQEKAKDWRYDNHKFIVSIAFEEFSAGVFNPELDENFDATANLTNEASRWNKRLWPVFNLLRHFPQLIIGLLRYSGSNFTFVPGQGNYKAVTIMDPASDDLMVVEVPFAQDGNVPVDTEVVRGGPLHSDDLYEFTHACSWNQYKALRLWSNRKKAFGMSSEFVADPFDYTFDETFHPEATEGKFFIKRLERSLNSSTRFIAWKSYEDI